MKKILIATSNKGKLVEYQKALSEAGYQVVSPVEAGVPAGFDPEETGDTFEQNAVLKAREYGDVAKMLTLADDAGLEVDALDGRPGVYSHRYAETNELRQQKLLDELKDVKDEDRTARFRAVLALYDPANDHVETFTGTFEGSVTKEQRGENGFGYDPLFYYPPMNKTSAEMTMDEKNSVSHRGQVLKKVIEYLK